MKFYTILHVSVWSDNLFLCVWWGINFHIKSINKNTGRYVVVYEHWTETVWGWQRIMRDRISSGVIFWQGLRNCSASRLTITTMSHLSGRIIISDQQETTVADGRVDIQKWSTQGVDCQGRDTPSVPCWLLQ